MALHICLSSWRSLEIQMNEDGRAAGKKHKDLQSNILYLNIPCGETELQKDI